MKENITKSKVFWGTAAVLILVSIAWAASTTLRVGVDFHYTFYPAGRALLEGRSPYSVDSFFNPPWLLGILVPLALLPEKMAWGAFTSISLACYLVALRRFGAKPIALTLVLLSPFVLFNLWHGNIDSLILLGAALPPVFGIWLVLLKPQMGFVLVLLWCWQAYHKGGWRPVIWLVGPVGVALLASAATGLLRAANPAKMVWSTSVWPWGIPVGLLLALLAWKKTATVWRSARVHSCPLMSPPIPGWWSCCQCSTNPSPCWRMSFLAGQPPCCVICLPESVHAPVSIKERPGS